RLSRRAFVIQSVHRDRYKDRSLRFGVRDVVCSLYGARNIYGPMRFDAPLYIWFHKISLSPPEKWLCENLLSILLAGSYDERSLRVPRGHYRTHRVADSSGRV